MKLDFPKHCPWPMYEYEDTGSLPCFREECIVLEYCDYQEVVEEIP